MGGLFLLLYAALLQMVLFPLSGIRVVLIVE